MEDVISVKIGANHTQVEGNSSRICNPQLCMIGDIVPPKQDYQNLYHGLGLERRS